MERLTPELSRILQKRIVKALDRVKYYPASAPDLHEIAAEVLRPYQPLTRRHDDHET